MIVSYIYIGGIRILETEIPFGYRIRTNGVLKKKQIVRVRKTLVRKNNSLIKRLVSFTFFL